ncbi:MAG TPA: diaminopimelate decarboxylase, partial [Acetobacteraceae bacterium]|nr:diaminopimelate decarboxylase [Acetobacteraceae bacterium]
MDSFSAHEPDIADLLAARPALAMDAQAGLLFEGVPLNAIADSIGTPSWVYGAGSVRGQISRLKTALDAAPVKAHIHYAVKANDHLAILA